MNSWEGHCFGCSRKNVQGLQLRFSVSEQGCFTRCMIPDHFCGFDGLAHGGIIATLLDEVSAWTIISRLGKFGITQEIRIRYLKPVPTNTEIMAEGKILNCDEKNGAVQAAILSAEGTLLAESESQWVFPSLSIISRISGVEESTLKQFLASSSRKEEGVER
ncbi:MAG: PaaI family thioesterase [Thermodesulfobacteriota bacterium]|nr:PaaI family thioesterase [Thermodesulfobacteriota bacterium]